MGDDLDATIIKNTQISLGKYVKRPPLTDKLLRKPPFRFLHDIVTSVLKSKGFFDGLFEENELISDNVKDRESKISFLSKVITVVSLTTGKTLTTKPSKIVAGQEPAKTNELLQCLALALDNNLSSDEAVKKFKSGVKIPAGNEKKNEDSVKSSRKNIESKKLTSRSSEKLQTNEKDGQYQNKIKSKGITIRKKESPPKKSVSKTLHKKATEKTSQEGKKNSVSEQKDVLINQKPEDNLPKHNQQELVINDDTAIQDKKSNLDDKILQPNTDFDKDLSIVTTFPSEEHLVSDIKESNLKVTNPDKSMQINEDLARLEIDTKESITSTQSLSSDKSEINRSNDEIKNQLSHNSEETGVSEILEVKSEESSRLPAKSNKDTNNPNISRPSSVRPSSSRPGAPRIRDKSENVMSEADNILVGKVNIIRENLLEEEEDTSIIIESNKSEETQETFQNPDHNFVNQNSHLVQQILDSQKEFSQISGKTEIEWQFRAQKAPDIIIQEMEQFKFSVQALSRIANPLGKLLDHIQEDVEVMRQELQQWTQLYEETSKDLLVQKNATNEALVPFQTKIKQLTADIEERHEKITDLKISIHKNNLRIEKLLTNNNVQ